MRMLAVAAISVALVLTLHAQAHFVRLPRHRPHARMAAGAPAGRKGAVGRPPRHLRGAAATHPL
jgi:hypothetical protein